MAGILLFFWGIFYWGMLPSLLNVVISRFIAKKFFRQGLKMWLMFFFVSILLTFGTRIPGFVDDALNASADVVEIKRSTRLGPSDILNLQLATKHVRWRADYLTASSGRGYGSASFGGIWIRQAELTESAARHGVAVNTGKPVPGHPILRSSYSETSTHALVDLEVISKDQVIAEYRRRIRLNFVDEIGATGVRYHFLHLMKNTYWNFLARVVYDPSAPNPYEFMERAIYYSSNVESSVELSSAIRQIEETVIWEHPIAHKELLSKRRGFDCSNHPSATMERFYSTAHIKTKTFQKELRLSERVSPKTDVGKYGFSTIICGEDGYAALIYAADSPRRIVLFDKNWQEQEVFEINLPRTDAREGHKLLRHAFYQSESELILRYLVRPNIVAGELDYPPTKEAKVFRISHCSGIVILAA